MSLFGAKEKTSYSTAEKTTVGLAVVVLFIVGLAIFDDDFAQRIWGSSGENLSRPILGRISTFENDARHKSSDSMAWNKARRKQNVRLGDAVFSGTDSNVQVVMDRGSRIDLGPNTMIVFNEIGGVKMPNFIDGNFRLDVNGSMTIGIQGKVTKIEGYSAEVQIYLGPDKKPQVRVLNGWIALTERDRPQRTLARKEFVTLGAQKSAQQPVPERAAAAAEAVSPVITPIPGADTVTYTNRLYDFFETDGNGTLKRRTTPPFPMRLPYTLRWNLRRGDEPVFDAPVWGQFSPSQDFSGTVTSFRSKGEAAFEIRDVVEGDNYWRISLDGKTWSQAIRFRAERRNLNADVRLFRADRKNLVLKSTVVNTSLRIQSSQQMRGYVLEESRSPDFSGDDLKVHWLSRNVAGLALKSPGRFYYRVRGVDAATELTAPSNVEEVIVVKPPAHPLQRLANRREDKPRESHREEVLAKSSSDPERPKSTERRPSAVNTFSAKVEPPNQGPINQGYLSSKLEFETGGFTVFSPDQADLGKANPLAVILGLRSRHWFGRSGLEGAVRVKAADANYTARDINPLSLEARYHYKVHPKFLGITQMSVIGGYEMYRNIGQGFFVQKYDLAKIGFSLDFPVKNRWDMGGEVLYGRGEDGSQKFELGGRVNYYLQKNWSCGVGYRTYLFEAGSQKTAPLELPYKETYGEGYSVIQWHY